MSDNQDSNFSFTFNQTQTKKKSLLNKSSETCRHSNKIEENPTHFLELNNTTYESDTKLIKVKIIVPKGTLTNSKFDHKRNVLTVMNDIDKIKFNVRATTEQSSEILKITNILNSGDQQNDSTNLEEPKICQVVSLNSRQKNNYPIMGTNALLVKTHSVDSKNSQSKLDENSLTDSAIIQELVTQRYQDNMIELYQRSFIRQTSRRSSLKTDSRTTSENSVDKDINYNFLNNIKHSSTMLNELDNINYFDNSELPSLEYGSVIDTLKEYEEVRITQPIISIGEITSTSQSRDTSSFNSSDFHVDVNLGSAIDFILSTNGNDLDTSSSREKTCCVENNSVKDCVASNGTPQSRSDFDEDKFLQRALGDEFNGYASTDSCAKTGMAGSSEIDTNDTSIVSSRSVNSSDVSMLLSKASSLYSTVSCKIRHLGKRIPLHSSEGTISEEADQDDGSLDTSTGLEGSERMTRLMQESVAQYQIMVQTGKALSYCRSVKEFVGSMEQIEAERMLLLATSKRQSILDAICKYEYEDEHHQQQNSRGTIIISNLVFHPKENSSPIVSNCSMHIGSGRSKGNLDTVNQWFVCIINCNELMYATEAKMVGKDGFVRFGDEKFQFDGLAIDFELNVSLYAIKVKNGLRNYSHESKYHLKKDTNKSRSILCPPAPSTSFLQYLTLTRSPQSTSTSAIITKSSFIPFGTSALRINHLTHNSKDNNTMANAKYYRLTKMPAVASSQFSGVFGAEVETMLIVQSSGSGFITIGRGDKVTTWSRYWCVLEGSELKWWNYPQVESVERAEALGSIDLRTCISARITSVDRNMCAKPRTLSLETSDHHEDKSNTRHLLSFDNTQEMQAWERELNTVVGILRSWNAMDIKYKMYCSKITSN